MAQKNETSESKAFFEMHGLTDDDMKILMYIKDKGGVASMEDFTENCGLAMNVLASRLTILGIRGILRQESGNRYVLADII